MVFDTYLPMMSIPMMSIPMMSIPICSWCLCIASCLVYHQLCLLEILCNINFWFVNLHCTRLSILHSGESRHADIYSIACISCIAVDLPPWKPYGLYIGIFFPMKLSYLPLNNFHIFFTSMVTRMLVYYLKIHFSRPLHTWELPSLFSYNLENNHQKKLCSK